jgi:spore coat polysaccharide biosynthesis protein SpsF
VVTGGFFTLAILQARMSSSRLPGKVMMPINGEPMIYRQIERIRQASTIDKIVVATSTDPSDDSLAKYLRIKGVEVFRGSLDDVLSRFLEIQKEIYATGIIRLTGDCPLVMPKLIDTMVAKFYETDVDYLSNTLSPTYPDGLDVEVIKPSALAKLAVFDLSETEREHVTLGIYSRPEIFTLVNFRFDEDLSQRRWTVDYHEDLEFVRQVFSEFEGRESLFTLEDMMALMVNNPDFSSGVSVDRRNEQLGGKEIGK